MEGLLPLGMRRISWRRWIADLSSEDPEGRAEWVKGSWRTFRRSWRMRFRESIGVG